MRAEPHTVAAAASLVGYDKRAAQLRTALDALQQRQLGAGDKLGVVRVRQPGAAEVVGVEVVADDDDDDKLRP